MSNVVYHILFLLFTIYVLIQSIIYSISEIKNEKNTFGGSCVIIFSIFCVVFSNIVVWMH